MDDLRLDEFVEYSGHRNLLDEGEARLRFLEAPSLCVYHLDLDNIQSLRIFIFY